MTQADIKNTFIEEYNKYVKREGAQEFLTWLESTDFFHAPASTKYHNSYDGGLAKHSVSVFYETIRLLKAYTDIKVSGETAAICALLHDVCKANCYNVEMRNVKENGQWTQKPFYVFDEEFCYGGHGSKSVYLIQRYMKLTDEEAIAINCHMGFSNGDNVGSISNAYKQFPFAWLLHVADEASTYLMEV